GVYETITDDEGNYEVQAPVQAGENPITVKVNETATTEAATEETSITADKQTPTVTAEATPAKAGQETTISGTVTDEDGNPVAGAPVRVEVGNGVYETTTDDEGNYEVQAPVQAGENPITVKVNETATTEAGNATTNVTADKQSPEVEVTTTPAKAGENTTVTAKVTDEDGNPVAGAPVTVKVGDNEVSGTTDENGTFKADLPVEAGDNPVSVEVGETPTTEPAKEESTITADKQTPTVTAEATPAKAGENTTVSGKVTDENGNPVADAPVRVEVGDGVYETTTDDEGNYEVQAPVQAGENPITVKVNETATTLPANATTSVTADKQTPTVEANVTPAKAGENTTVTAKVTDENGNPVKDAPVTIKVGDNTVTGTTDENGTFKADLPVEAGENPVTVEVGETPTTEAATEETAIIAEKQTPTVTAEATPAKAGENTTVSGKVTDENGNPVAGAPVRVEVGNGVYETTTDDEGNYEVQAPVQAGENPITVKVGETDTTLPANATTNVTTDKQTPNVEANVIPAKVGENATVSGKVTDEDGNPVANAPVTVKVGDKEVTVTTDDEGNFNASVPVTKDGETPVSVTVPETDTTKQLTEDLEPFDAEKQTPTVEADVTPAKVGENATVSGKVTDENGKPVANAPVTVKVGDKEVPVTTDANGNFNASVPVEEAGETPVSVTVGETNSTEPVTEDLEPFDAEKQTPEVEVTTTPAKAGENTTVTAKVTDENGNPVKDAPVTVKVGDNTVTGKTDENGTFKADLPVKAGDNPVSVEVGETPTTEPAKENTTVKADKQTPTVTANVTPAKAGENTTVSGKVTDENGKPVANAPVNVTVGDKTYPTTTDANGNYNVTAPVEAGENPVTVKVGETGTTKPANATTSVNAPKQNANVTVNNITPVKVGENATVSGKVTDENGKPVANAPVTVKVGDKTVKVTTDANGKYNASVPVTKAGNNSVSVSVGETNTTKPANKTSSVNASKLNTTITIDPIKDVKVGENATVSGKVTDENGKPVANAPVTIKVDGKTISATTDKDGKYTASVPTSSVGTKPVTASVAATANTTASNATATMKVNKHDSKIVLDAINDTKVGQKATITGTLTDDTNAVIANAPVVVTVDGVKYNATTNANGKFTVKANTSKVGVNNVTATYAGSSTDNPANTTGTFNVVKLETTTTIDPVNAMIYDNITITAKVVDEFGANVEGGRVIFRVNGQALKDENNNTIIATVVNGTATANVTVPKAWNKTNVTIAAVYQGNDKYLSSTGNNTVNVTKRIATMTVLTSRPTAKGGDQIILSAVVGDKGKLVNGGTVIFKLNGLTIKDASGKAIATKVVNGVASLEYMLPDGMSAKNITLTAVYSNEVYERAEANGSFVVEKANVQIISNVTKAKSADKTVPFTAQIVDANGHLAKGTTQVAIKINGATVAKVNAQDGIINTTLDIAKYKAGVYQIDIAAGGNNRYNPIRGQTVLQKV
ncbi:MAG: hypothetical protein BZ136_00965, partial [Methanosphaera sp. rholeuAM74]